VPAITAQSYLFVYGAAPLVNPALLAISDATDDVSIIFPSVGVMVSDPDNLENSAGTGKAASSANELKNALHDISGHSDDG
jgi:hypothetical protein